MIMIFLIIGLMIGSFLNVLICRLYTAEKLFLDRSRCPHCKKQIRWFDNIPVLSFMLLKSECRDCKGKISWQYPAVEIGTGLVFALIGWKFFNLGEVESWILTFFYLFSAASLIVIFVYDFLYMEIPGEVLWVSIFVAVFFVLYLDGTTLLDSKTNMINLLDSRVYSGVLAAMVAFVFFFSLSFFSKEKFMGMGDAYVVIFLGLVLGWPEIILALFLSFAIGSIYGIISVSLKKKKMKSQIPFAPFLVVGTFIALFFYVPIINWYFSLFY